MKLEAEATTGDAIREARRAAVLTKKSLEKAHLSAKLAFSSMLNSNLCCVRLTTSVKRPGVRVARLGPVELS